VALEGRFLVSALFGFKGRMKRLDYWLAAIGLAVGRGVVLILALGITHMRMGTLESLPLRLSVDLAFLWPSAAIVIKRGHDRDRSTRWSGVVVVVLYGLGVAFGALMDLGFHEAGTLSLLAVLLGSFYMLIDYGLADGTPGPNRYGASPKGRTDSDVAKTFD
jgi:uncharacterized membrane protein YhaH (DUF805 family)